MRVCCCVLHSVRSRGTVSASCVQWQSPFVDVLWHVLLCQVKEDRIRELRAAMTSAMEGQSQAATAEVHKQQVSRLSANSNSFQMGENLFWCYPGAATSMVHKQQMRTMACLPFGVGPVPGGPAEVLLEGY